MRLPMEQCSAKKRSLIGSERFVYFATSRCHRALGDVITRSGTALAADVAEVRDAVEGGVDAGREQR